MPLAAKPDKNSIDQVAPEAASAAGLRYLTDTRPGIGRKGTAKNFSYYNAKGQKITDEKILDRIRELVIPPAWTDVWICASPNGHIQVTGRDTKGRKQYIYHPAWNNCRSETKFGSMLEFGKLLPLIRKKIKADLRLKELCCRKITAIALNLLDQSLIRVGNQAYARTNKSYGLTTLRDRHVKISGAELRFEFTGKKGVVHSVSVQDKKLAQLVKQCRDIPGYDLFQYYDKEGERHTLESGNINAYLREITQTDFTAKDFRTWGGTVRMVECLEELIIENPDREKEKTVKEAIKMVAKALGNTPAVCSKYYVHPEIIQLFRDDKLPGFLKRQSASAKTRNKDLSNTEVLVLKMLKKVK